MRTGAEYLVEIVTGRIGTTPSGCVILPEAWSTSFICYWWLTIITFLNDNFKFTFRNITTLIFCFYHNEVYFKALELTVFRQFAFLPSIFVIFFVIATITI